MKGEGKNEKLKTNNFNLFKNMHIYLELVFLFVETGLTMDSRAGLKLMGLKF